MMKADRWVFMAFLVCSALFIVGAIVKLDYLELVANVLLVPTLLVYYRIRANEVFYPIVGALVLLYIRDIFLTLGHEEYPVAILVSLIIALLLLLLCAISVLQKTKIEPIEYLSFLIMYGFLIFVFIFFSEMVPELIPRYAIPTIVYLLLLVLFLAVSFSAYLLKSHKGTLWLMIGASSLLFSELSLFFKLFVLEDISLIVFFPVFHVFAYYALTQHALNRRKSSFFPHF